MATRTKQFFCEEGEFFAILGQIVSKLQLCVILFRGIQKPFIKICESINAIERDVHKYGVSLLFLSETPIDIKVFSADNFQPAHFGLVQVGLPRETGGVLFMGEFGLKTDSFEPSTGRITDNTQGVKLYDRIIREFKKFTKSGVRAKNVVTGASGSYRDIVYTSSAELFAAKGGRLMQEGVNNILFFIEPQRSPKTAPR